MFSTPGFTPGIMQEEKLQLGTQCGTEDACGSPSTTANLASSLVLPPP